MSRLLYVNEIKKKKKNASASSNLLSASLNSASPHQPLRVVSQLVQRFLRVESRVLQRCLGHVLLVNGVLKRLALENDTLGLLSNSVQLLLLHGAVLKKAKDTT